MCFLTHECARIVAGFTRICEEPFVWGERFLGDTLNETEGMR